MLRLNGPKWLCWKPDPTVSGDVMAHIQEKKLKLMRIKMGLSGMKETNLTNTTTLVRDDHSHPLCSKAYSRQETTIRTIAIHC